MQNMSHLACQALRTAHKKQPVKPAVFDFCLFRNVKNRNECSLPDDYDIFGMENSAPDATPTGHRLVMVLSLV
jgi:hypothetical protein